jgi:hypothetical protein
LLTCTRISKEWRLAGAIEIEAALRGRACVQAGAILCTDISSRSGTGRASTDASAR